MLLRDFFGKRIKNKIHENLEGHNGFCRQMTENLIFKRQKSQFLAVNRQYDPLITPTLFLTKFENRIPNKTYL